MKYSVALVIDVPCFKCLFWDEKKESHLNCNPNDCEFLTEWALKEAIEDQQESIVLIEPHQTPIKTLHL